MHEKPGKGHNLKGDFFNDNELTVQNLTSVYTDSHFWTVYGQDKLDGWIYEEVVSLGLTQTYYIYSDFRTAIKGHFRAGVLASGVETRIIGYRLTIFLLVAFIVKNKHV